MKHLLSALCLLLLTSQTVEGVDAIRNSVVRLHVTRRAPDMLKPWTKSSPGKVTGSGVVIEGGRILTNAHVLRYASQVFVQLHQGGDQLPARLAAVAPRIDLAVVELEDPSLIADIAPLPLTDELPLIKSTVNVYGYPMGGDDLSVTEGIVSRIEFTGYYYDGSGVRIQVDAALNSGNSGGPAMQDGQIVGLVFSGIKEADNIGYLIPAQEIQTFLDDVADGTFSGKPRLFDRFTSAENKALRDFLKLRPEDTGVVVGAPYRDADDYPLKRWDVITHIGPHNIDNLGYVAVGDELRLHFGYYVAPLTKDGHVEMTIRRDAEPHQVKVPVTPDRSILLPILRDGYPKYFIYGPLVFTAATQEYIRALGSRGYFLLSRLDSPLVKRQFEPPAFDGEELVVIATRPFPHRITKGYDQMTFGVVTHVNEAEVKNLRQFAELLRDNTDDFLELTLAGKHESLVFRRSEIESSTEDILTDEGIRYRSSQELRDIWQ